MDTSPVNASHLSPETREFFTSALSRDDAHHLRGLLELLMHKENTSGYDESLLEHDAALRATTGLSLRENEVVNHFRKLSPETRAHFMKAMGELDAAERETFEAKQAAKAAARRLQAFRMSFAVVGALIANELIALNDEDYMDTFEAALRDTADIIEEQLRYYS